jgi:hypothetical protein
MTAPILSDDFELAQKMVHTRCIHSLTICLVISFFNHAVYNFNAYPALFVFEDGKHRRYTGGREAKDIVLYMSAVSKGLDPHDEEAKLKPGLYKGVSESNHKKFADQYSWPNRCVQRWRTTIPKFSRS